MQLNYVTPVVSPIDLEAYANQLGYSSYLINQPLSDVNLNVVIAPSFDIYEEIVITNISSNVVCLSSKNTITLGMLKDWDTLINHIEKDEYDYNVIKKLLISITQSKKLTIKLNDFLIELDCVKMQPFYSLLINILINTNKDYYIKEMNIDSVLNIIITEANELSDYKLLEDLVDLGRNITFADVLSKITDVTSLTLKLLNKLSQLYRPVDTMIKISLSLGNFLVKRYPKILFLKSSDARFGNILVKNNRNKYLRELTPIISGFTGQEEFKLLGELAKF